MKFDPDDISNIPIINNPNITYDIFEVNGQNYNRHFTYNCAQGHEGAVPRIFPYIKTFSQITSKVTMTGIIVFVCPDCGAVVKKQDEHRMTHSKA